MIRQTLDLTLAAAVNAETLKLIFFVIVMLIGGFMKMLSASREQAEKNKTAKPQGPPKRENRFRNEIELFLEEVGRRRSSGDRGPNEMTASKRSRTPAPADPQKARSPARPEPPRTPAVPPGNEVRERKDRTAPRAPASSARVKVEAPKPAPTKALPPSPFTRPGAEIAARKAPVSDDLGTQVRAHLAKFLDSTRMSQQVQTDLGNAVERAIRDHLGQAVTRGTTETGAPQKAAAGVHPIVALLRSPAGVRNAIMVNEILGPPAARRASTRAVRNSG